MSEERSEGVVTRTQTAQEWITGVSAATHLDERDAYRALRAVLHMLRDGMAINEVAQLAAQLPITVRAIYYDGWQPAKAPGKVSREEFLEAIQGQINSEIDPLNITQAVLRVMRGFIGSGEMDKVRHCFPRPVQKIFPPPERPASA